MSTRAHPDYGAAPVIRDYELKLYVTDWTPRCVNAYRILKRICREFLNEETTIEVIDILEKPELARRDKIVAVPTLVKLSPKPYRMLIGDLTDESKLLSALGINRKQN